MKRIHAFEFEDLDWFPKNLRNYATDFLQFGANTFDAYKPIVPLLETAIRNSGKNMIVDIASGGGGGLVKLSEHLLKTFPDLKITLSDYYPNLDAFKRTKNQRPQVFDFVETPVDAMNVPASLTGLRTQFLSFHHFKPEQAKAILQNAVDSKQPIAIFEAQQRNIKSLIPMLFSPLTVLLMTPFIRPFKWDRLLFTYLIPIMPVFVLWDGVVSVLRTYTMNEMNAMIAELKNSYSFEWNVGLAKGKPGDVLYLTGKPRT